MGRVAQYSTRLLGFHLRYVETGEGARAGTFQTRIFHGEQVAGVARLPGGGVGMIIHIRRQHADAWGKLTSYLRSHPVGVAHDGTEIRPDAEEEVAVFTLLAIYHAERRVLDSSEHDHGLLAFRWDRPFPEEGWWATPQVLFSGDAVIPAERVEPCMFRILQLGEAHQRFEREEPTPPPVGEQDA